MALQSQAFRGDSRLEAAATTDSAHLVQGTQGPHVSKIQNALNALDAAGLVVDASYGSKTAAAVLTYKKRRGIVGPNSTDNIVGRGTMASLDAEMAKRERGQPNPLPPLPPPSPPEPAPPLGVFFGIRCDAELEGETVLSTLPPSFFQIADFMNQRAAHYRFDFPGGNAFGGIFTFDRVMRVFNTNQFISLEGMGLPAVYSTTVNLDEDGRESLASSMSIEFSPASAFPTRVEMGVHASADVQVLSRPSRTIIARPGRLKFLKLLPFPPPRFVPR